MLFKKLITFLATIGLFLCFVPAAYANDTEIFETNNIGNSIKYENIDTYYIDCTDGSTRGIKNVWKESYSSLSPRTVQLVYTWSIDDNMKSDITIKNTGNIDISMSVYRSVVGGSDLIDSTRISPGSTKTITFYGTDLRASLSEDFWTASVLVKVVDPTFPVVPENKIEFDVIATATT